MSCYSIEDYDKFLVLSEFSKVCLKIKENGYLSYDEMIEYIKYLYNESSQIYEKEEFSIKPRTTLSIKYKNPIINNKCILSQPTPPLIIDDNYNSVIEFNKCPKWFTEPDYYYEQVKRARQSNNWHIITIIHKYNCTTFENAVEMVCSLIF